jgi:hypothetical protein
MIAEPGDAADRAALARLFFRLCMPTRARALAGRARVRRHLSTVLPHTRQLDHSPAVRGREVPAVHVQQA